MSKKCDSRICQKSKLRNCWDVAEEERDLIYTSFWEMTSWSVRQNVVTAMVTSVSKKQKKSENNKRSHNFMYKLRLQNGTVVQVCKIMFYSTLGMPERTINDWLNAGTGKCPDDNEDIEKSVPSKSMPDEDAQFIKEWLLKVPCVDSHYCRKVRAYKENRFLEPGTKVIDLYNLYASDAISAERRVAGLTYFKNTFHSLKMSVFMPRKDQCDTCIAAKMGNITVEEHQTHLALKDDARKQKDQDKERELMDESVSVWTMDTQSVLLCPQSKASALYYKTKLQLHNFAMYNMCNRDGYCYVWDETKVDVSSEVFAYLQYSYFKTTLHGNRNIKELIIWSDGCGYQNKNAYL